MSKLANDLRPVVASLQTVAHSLQGTIDAFERIEPAKVVEELERLGTRVSELGGMVDATRTAQAETLPDVVEKLRLLEARVDEQIDATRMAETLRNVRAFGFGIVAAIVLVGAMLLWLMLTLS